MSDDGTGTMSVQLVLCVADSVWRAAGHFWLGSACPRGTRIAPAHDAAVAAGCALIPLPSQSVPAMPRPQLVLVLAYCSWCCVSPTLSGVRLGTCGSAETATGAGVAVLLWPIRRTIDVVVHQ